MTRIEEILNRYVFWTDDLLEETRREILRELERATKEVDAENLRLTEENISLRADVQIQRNQLGKANADLAALNLCEPHFLDRVLRERDSLKDRLGSETERASCWFDECAKQAGKAMRLHEALAAVVRDVNEYERVNGLSPNRPRLECWDSVAHAKTLLTDD